MRNEDCTSLWLSWRGSPAVPTGSGAERGDAQSQRQLLIA